MQSQFQRDIAVQQAVIGKTYHIMALQGKLLALTEDLELFRKENADYKDKNDKLNKKVIHRMSSFIYAHNVVSTSIQRLDDVCMDVRTTMSLNLFHLLQVMDLAIKFDAERRQSRRLNEQVLNHSENCKNEKQVKNTSGNPVRP